MPAKSHVEAIQPKNHYDGGRTICTCDDKLQASRISGHTWNILNNREDHEVYFKEMRNDAHYIDKNGNGTGHWLQRKKRLDLDGDGIIDCVDSSNVAETMVCPPTAGKEASHNRTRQMRQICQVAADRDFGKYKSHRESCGVPPTPGRGGCLERKVRDQARMRDIPERPTPRVLDRKDFTPRRGEPRVEHRPPHERDMFKKVDQLRTDSHMDCTEPNFQDAIGCRSSSLGISGAHALGGTLTSRSVLGDGVPPKPAEHRSRHSVQRMEHSHHREITHWPFAGADKTKQGDPYHAKPVQQTGSSCVKYDIISNERKQFWY